MVDQTARRVHFFQDAARRAGDAGDGSFDVVGCGPGHDTVVTDRIDLVWKH